MAAALSPLLLVLLACSGGKDDTGDGGTPDGGSTDGGVADGGTEDGGTHDVEPPCADGGWGLIDPKLDLVHVHDGAEDGDGSTIAPLSDLDEALALADDRGAVGIALWPGSYSGRLVLEAEHSGWSMLGCSATEVTLRPADDSMSGVLLYEAADVTLAGFTIDGGILGLWFAGDASGTVQGVEVTGAASAGIVIDGSEKVATVSLNDVGITGSGFGLVARGGTTTASDLRISDSTTVGLLASSSATTLSVTDLVVSGVSPVGGQLGRGVQAQSYAQLSVGGASSITSVSDAGLFVHLASATVDGLAISEVAPAAGKETGDAVVVSAVEDPELGAVYPPESFPSSLTGLTVDGAARAGVYAEGVQLTADDTCTTGDACTLYALEGTELLGGDADAFVGLAEALDLDRTPVDLSWIGDD